MGKTKRAQTDDESFEAEIEFFAPKSKRNPSPKRRDEGFDEHETEWFSKGERQ